MSKCALLLLLLTLSGASAAPLTVTAHYPSSQTSPAVQCNAVIALSAGVATYGREAAPMAQQPSKTEWISSIDYTPQDVGRRVQLTFEIILHAVNNTPVVPAGCAEVCPALQSSLRNLGATLWVELKEGSTQVDAWPYFCTYRGKNTEQALYSPELGTNRTLFVYRPPGLVENPLPRPSAMAAVHDGSLAPLISAMLDGLLVAGEIQELVLVGVDSASDVIANYRGALLTPWVSNSSCVCSEPAAWCNASMGVNPSGRGDDYLQFIVKQALPTVSAQLGVTLDRRTTVSWGYSLGGLTAAYHAYAAPETFGLAIAGSPSLWYNCGEILEPLIAGVPPASKLYIDVGNAEGSIMDILPRVVYQRLLERDAFSDGANLWLTEGEGDFHDVNGFITRIPRALKAILPAQSGDPSHYAPPSMDWGPNYRN